MTTPSHQNARSVSLLAAGALFVALTSLVACGDDHDDHDHDHDNENEVITTVTLTFSADGQPDQTFAFDDADGDGGAAPTVDTIALAAAAYDVSVTFTNKLASPAEDITAEVADEAQEHQVFFTGDAVDGPAAGNPGAPLTQTYADQDANNLPIGLANEFLAVAGDGSLVLTLRHLPPVGGTAVKTADLAAAVKTGGFAAIGGDTDVQVTFPVVISAGER